MKGIWHLHTKTIDQGLAIVVFDGIAAAVVISFTIFSIFRRSKHWPEAWALYTGMALLSAWFVLNWADILSHRHQASVPYGYILANAFFRTLRGISDVFLFWGFYKIVIRYRYLRPNISIDDFVWSRFFSIILGILAAYHLCLLWALSFAWLSFADVEIIHKIAKGRSGFEIGFTAVQFCGSLTLPCIIAFDVLRMDSTHIAEHYDEQAMWALAASIALLLRSFCEVIIVGQLDRWPADIERIMRGRDVTYGLFSMFFVACIAFAVPKNAAEDPLVDTEFEWIEDIRSRFITELRELTEDGKKTGPTILSILKSTEKSLGTSFSSQEYFIKNNEIKRLREIYGDWESIHKCQGKKQFQGRKLSGES